MESRHDSENAERILYNMSPKQLVSEETLGLKNLFFLYLCGISSAIWFSSQCFIDVWLP